MSRGITSPALRRLQGQHGKDRTQTAHPALRSTFLPDAEQVPGGCRAISTRAVVAVGVGILQTSVPSAGRYVSDMSMTMVISRLRRHALMADHSSVSKPKFPASTHNDTNGFHACLP